MKAIPAHLSFFQMMQVFTSKWSWEDADQRPREQQGPGHRLCVRAHHVHAVRGREVIGTNKSSLVIYTTLQNHSGPQ